MNKNYYFWSCFWINKIFTDAFRVYRIFTNFDHLRESKFFWEQTFSFRNYHSYKFKNFLKNIIVVVKTLWLCRIVLLSFLLFCKTIFTISEMVGARCCTKKWLSLTADSLFYSFYLSIHWCFHTETE